MKLVKDSHEIEAVSGVAIKISGLSCQTTLLNWNSGGKDIDCEKDKLMNKLKRLTEQAKEAQLSLYIDAEQAPIQGAIDSITRTLMQMFNTGKVPIVFGTHQTYLKNSNAALTRTAIIAAGCEPRFHG